MASYPSSTLYQVILKGTFSSQELDTSANLNVLLGSEASCQVPPAQHHHLAFTGCDFLQPLAAVPAFSSRSEHLRGEKYLRQTVWGECFPGTRGESIQAAGNAEMSFWGDAGG